MVATLTKQPAESRLYDFDFTSLLVGSPAPTLVSGAAVTKALQTGDDTSSPLVIGAPTISSPKVQVRLSAGVNGAKLKLTCRCTDSLSNILEVEGFLKIKDI